MGLFHFHKVWYLETTSSMEITGSLRRKQVLNLGKSYLGSISSSKSGCSHSCREEAMSQSFSNKVKMLMAFIWAQVVPVSESCKRLPWTFSSVLTSSSLDRSLRQIAETITIAFYRIFSFFPDEWLLARISHPPAWPFRPKHSFL